MNGLLLGMQFGYSEQSTWTIIIVSAIILIGMTLLLYPNKKRRSFNKGRKDIMINIIHHMSAIRELEATIYHLQQTKWISHKYLIHDLQLHLKEIKITLNLLQKEYNLYKERGDRIGFMQIEKS